MKTIQTEEWWAALPVGEKEFIRTLMGMIKGAKRSQVREVACAARKWETAIGFFMKVRLKGKRVERRKLRVERLAGKHRTSNVQHRTSNGEKWESTSPRKILYQGRGGTHPYCIPVSFA